MGVVSWTRAEYWCIPNLSIWKCLVWFSLSTATPCLLKDALISTSSELIVQLTITQRTHWRRGWLVLVRDRGRLTKDGGEQQSGEDGILGDKRNKEGKWRYLCVGHLGRALAPPSTAKWREQKRSEGQKERQRSHIKTALIVVIQRNCSPETETDASGVRRQLGSKIHSLVILFEMCLACSI